jgi:hypothetical protein
MRYPSIVSPLACALVAAFCALAPPAKAQDTPRGGRDRDSDRQRDSDLRSPSRFRRESGPDRLESNRSGERRFDRGRGGRARDDSSRSADRRPGGASRGPSRSSRGERDDGWAELAMRMRRPEGARARQASLRGPRGFGGFGPPGFAGGISGGPGGGARGGRFGGPPPQGAGSGAIASELRELNSKLDRLTSAVERISQR